MLELQNRGQPIASIFVPTVAISLAAVSLALTFSRLGTQHGYTLFSVYFLLVLAWVVPRLYGYLAFKRLRAQPVDAGSHPELHALLRQLARRAHLQPPRLLIVESDIPNAFAICRNSHDSAVALTRGLLRRLDLHELAGVLGHELAHLKQDRKLSGAATATITGCAMLASNLVRFALIQSAGRNSLTFRLVTRPLAVIAATLHQLTAPRSREFTADALGASICENPLWLASALRKLAVAEPHASAAKYGALCTHPTVGERIRRLEAMAYRAYC